MTGFFINSYASGGVAAFAPTDVTDLRAWYDASDAASITSAANAISGWNDKSGNSNHLTQATAGLKPTLGTDATSGLGKVTFDGGDVLAANDSASLDINGTIAIFIAANFTTITNNDIILSKDTFYAIAWSVYAGGGSGQILRFNINGTDATIDTGTHVGRSLTTCIYDGTNMYTRWNRAAITTTAKTGAIVTTADKFHLGAADDSATSGFAGEVFEVLIYGTAMNNTNRDLIETYLRTKWSTV